MGILSTAIGLSPSSSFLTATALLDYRTRRVLLLRGSISICRSFALSRGQLVKSTASSGWNPGSSQKTMSAVPPPRKVHKSAVCIIPPEELWEPIQAIRRVYDKHYRRWMPHVNLLYPFWEDTEDYFDVAASKAVKALAQVSPFEVSLPGFSFFEHGRSCTLWLDPSPALGQLAALQASLEEAFPECNDLSAVISDSFKPHLSVGQWQNRREAERAVEELTQNWRPITFTVDRVYLISRANFHHPFHKRYAVPLGDPDATSASMRLAPPSGPSRTNNRQDNRRGGVTAAGVPSGSPLEMPPGRGEEDPDGASSAGAALSLAGGHGSEVDAGAGAVWNFAYGANMNRNKLQVVRGILPLESVPGRLRDHRLAFTHRGAMGNVEPMTGECVHGVLHRLTAVQFASLAATESEYLQGEVEVEAYDGRRMRALVFWTPAESRIPHGLPPPTRYLNLLRSGAASWHLEPEYVRWLEALPSVDARDRGAEYWCTPEGRKIQGKYGGPRDGAQRRRGGRGGGRSQRDERWRGPHQGEGPPS